MFFLCKGKHNMNELEALNMLLRLIGSSPVNSVTTPHPDASNARTTLNRIRRQAQRRGWWFNIDYNVTYSPDANGNIRIPDEISSFVAEDKNYIQRGKNLYNKYDNSYKFATDVVACRTVRILDWDDMPDCMQEHCAYFAAAQFVRDELEDPQKQQDLEKSAGQAMLDVKKQDLEEGQYNIFRKPRVVQARAGVQPYHRNNRRFHGDPDV